MCCYIPPEEMAAWFQKIFHSRHAELHVTWRTMCQIAHYWFSFLIKKDAILVLRSIFLIPYYVLNK